MHKLYHVTFSRNVKKIFKNGIEPQVKSVYKGAFGQELKDVLTIYAFTNFDDAVRWAARMNYDTGYKNISIIVFADNIKEWKQDIHFESAGAKGRWLKKIGYILPENIIKEIKLTQEMIRAIVQTLGKDIELTQTGEIKKIKKVKSKIPH